MSDHKEPDGGADTPEVDALRPPSWHGNANSEWMFYVRLENLAKTLLRERDAAHADLHNAKKSLARYQEVLDQNSDLKEQLAAANKRAEDAERDSRRYRWLRESNLDKDRVQVSAVTLRCTEYWLEELDQEIDEAMKQNG